MFDTVVFDAVTGVGDNSGSNTYSHTVSSLANRVLWFICNTSNVSAATYNGVAMTLLTTQTFGSTTCRVFFLYAPTSGTNTLSVTASSGWQGIVASYRGVAQVGVPEASTFDGSVSAITTRTTAVTTITNNAMALGFCVWDTSVGVGQNISSGGTERLGRSAATLQGTSISLYDSSSLVTPPASHSMTVNTDSGSGTMTFIRYSMQPAILGTGAPLLMALL